MCEYFGVSRENAHRALDDAIETKQIFEKLLVLMDEKGEPMESCPHPQQIFYVDLGMEPDEYDILRRREEEAIALD